MKTPKNILVIDDNPEDRELCKFFLEKKNGNTWDFSIREAATLSEGLESIKSFPPDCILLDYMLPDVDGIEALKIIKEEYGKDIGIILLTGTGNESVVVKAFKNGALDYLTKGKFDENRLLSAIEDAVHKMEIRKELQKSREELKKNNESLQIAKQELEKRQKELINLQLRTSIKMAEIKKESDRRAQELEEAQQLQHSMLPHIAPVLPNLDMAMYMKTCAEVGGDYYDYKIDGSGNITIIIGDATGHGVKAGIVVATVKSYFHTLANDLLPKELLRRISEGIRNLQVRNMYMGLTVIRVEKNFMNIASSGMPPLLYYEQVSGKTRSIQLKGPFLGSTLTNEIPQCMMKLSPGDAILAMTDGLPELFNEEREMLDYDRIINRFTTVADKDVKEVINEMEKLSLEWRTDNTVNDDVALIAIKAK